MSDLTDRLRTGKLRGIYFHIDRQRLEAADEIDRLTAELEEWRFTNKVDELERERDKLREHLGNLLAVLHGDGGHYEAEHGTDKSVADALEKYYNNLRTTDATLYALRERVAALEQQNERQRDE